MIAQKITNNLTHFFKDKNRLLLFISVTFCFSKTYLLGLFFLTIISIIQFYNLLKGKTTEETFFKNYFYLFIYSVIFPDSITKIILIELLIFFLILKRRKKEKTKVKEKFHEYLFLSFFGLLLINHAIFYPHFKGLDVYIYFLLIPLLFIGIKTYNLKISFKNSIKTYISSTILVTVLLTLIKIFNNKLLITTNTFFAEPIKLTHVYFGIYIGLTNVFLIILNSKKDRFISNSIDLSIFIFNCLLLTYIGARMALLSIIFVSLIYAYKKLPYRTSIKTSIFILFFIGLLFTGIKIPRVEYGIQEVKELRKSIETGNKENMIHNSWRNMYMRYLVMDYTFDSINDNWLLGIGMQNIKNQIGNKILDDGYKYFTKINTHNQYIHLLAGMGIFGLLYFLYMIYYIINQKDISIYFILFYLIVMLTESVLVRGKGILLFTFFLLLYLNKKQISYENSTHS